MAASFDAEFDVVIVGAGAGGCASAMALVQAGLQVALVEKGHELPLDDSTLDIGTVVQQGRFKSHELWLDRHARLFAPEEYFNVGGKTKWYGAALLRYGPAEFLADVQHQCRGWPIGHEELAPYYEMASRHLDVKFFDCEPDLAAIVAKLTRRSTEWRTEPMPLGLAADIAKDRREAAHFDGFASVAGLKSDAETAFLAPVRHAPNLTLLEGEEVIDLLPHPERVAEIIGVRLASGREILARSVLLAAGALHSPRLLQRYVERHGLQESIAGASHVGANLKLHLLTAMIALSPSVKTDLIRKTRLFLNDELPHSSVQPLGFDGELIATLMPAWVPRPIAEFLGVRSYGFFLQTEDGSHHHNRVIAAASDKGNRAYPIMDYDEVRLRPALREHRRLVHRFRAALRRAGMVAFSRRAGLAGTAHVSGTLIAGNDPRTSVVDAQGKVHGLHSLYVVDGSILPRSSRVNPSLTIYAWALRTAASLAQHLAPATRRPATLPAG